MDEQPAPDAPEHEPLAEAKGVIEIEITNPLLRPGLTLRSSVHPSDAFEKANQMLALARLINGPTRKGF